MDMRKAFSTVACQELTYQEVADFMCQANIDTVEVRLHKGNRFFDLSVEDVPDAIAYLKKRNIKVIDLGTNLDLCYFAPELVAEGEKCIDLAMLTEAKAIRVFLAPFIKRFSEESLHNEEDIVKMLKELCAYGADKDVEIWVETHNAFSTGESLKRIIDAVAHDNLKIIWDVMHPYEFGEMPEETLEFLGDWIAHVHIKDGNRNQDPDLILCRYAKLGEGTVPIKEIFDLLEKIGYQGHYSLEWEKEWRAEIKDVFADLSQVLRHFNDYMARIEA